MLIARGLINQPKILILDEPTSGLDPQTRHLLWQKLKELKSQGISQLICTQNMEEATLLCERVAIMHRGKILDVDTPRKLVSRYIGERLWEIEPSPGEREQIIRELQGRHAEYEVANGVVKVFHFEDEEMMRRLWGRPRAATLEDVFFKLTGGSLVE